MKYFSHARIYLCCFIEMLTHSCVINARVDAKLGWDSMRTLYLNNIIIDIQDAASSSQINVMQILSILYIVTVKLFIYLVINHFIGTFFGHMKLPENYEKMCDLMF